MILLRSLYPPIDVACDASILYGKTPTKFKSFWVELEFVPSNHEITLCGTSCDTGTPNTFFSTIGSVVSPGNWSKCSRSADTGDRSLVSMLHLFSNQAKIHRGVIWSKYKDGIGGHLTHHITYSQKLQKMRNNGIYAFEKKNLSKKR